LNQHPERAGIKALLDKIREIIKRSASATQAALIQKLNPIIRGWAQYHRHVVAKATFASIDHTIWQFLWKWAKRRHPSKGAHWIKQKYFPRVEKQDWVFTAQERSSKKTCTTTLFSAASLPIVRHVKIKQLANPFDPQWRSYFIQRYHITKFLYCPVP
jgi:RNA-directed DNA polymerase